MIDTLAALMFMEPSIVAAQGLPVRVGNRARDDVTGLYRLKDGDVFITIVNEGSGSASATRLALQNFSTIHATRRWLSGKSICQS